MSFLYLNLPQTFKMIKSNIFTILTSVIILYLSFASSSTFEGVNIFNIPYLDKIVHFSLYFLLMLVIIAEHRKSLINTRILIYVSLIPIIFGGVIEILQSGLTKTRSGDITDIMSNTAGVIFAILIWILIRPYSIDKVR